VSGILYCPASPTGMIVQDLEGETKKKKAQKGGKKTKYILISSKEEDEQSADESA
jgi:hypothetical protein